MADNDVARYQSNLRGEVDGAALYRALSEAETDPHLKEVYRRLAAVEEAHAEFWRRQLDRVGVKAPRPRPGQTATWRWGPLTNWQSGSLGSNSHSRLRLRNGTQLAVSVVPKIPHGITRT